MVVTTRFASGSARDHNLCGAVFLVCSSRSGRLRRPIAARAALPRGDRPTLRRQRQRSTTPSAPAIARSAANNPPLLPQAGRRRGPLIRAKPIFLPSAVMSRRQSSRIGSPEVLAAPYVAMTAEDICYFQFLRKRPRAHYLIAFPNRIPRGRADIASLVSVTAPCV